MALFDSHDLFTPSLTRLLQYLLQRILQLYALLLQIFGVLIGRIFDFLFNAQHFAVDVVVLLE
jgi:hypothetical protein